MAAEHLFLCWGDTYWTECQFHAEHFRDHRDTRACLRCQQNHGGRRMKLVQPEPCPKRLRLVVITCWFKLTRDNSSSLVTLTVRFCPWHWSIQKIPEAAAFQYVLELWNIYLHWTFAPKWESYEDKKGSISPLSFFEAEFWFASLVLDCQLSDLSLKDWRWNYLCSCLYFQMVAQTTTEHGFGKKYTLMCDYNKCIEKYIRLIYAQISLQLLLNLTHDHLWKRAARNWSS